MLPTPSVSSVYARALAGFLHSRGLQVSAPSAPSSRVGGEAFGSTLQRAGEVLGDRGLGVAFGTRVGGAAFGLLGVAAASAPTLLAAIGHLQRFESLTSTLGRMRARRHGRHVTLSWEPIVPVPPAVVEGILAGWVSFGRFLLDQPVPVVGLGFAHAGRGPLHEDLLQCPVRFGAGEHSVTIDDELLAMRPRCADERLNGALGGWLDRCTAAVDAPRERPTTHRVAALLAEDLSLEEPAVAARLRVGPRTLQRRLAVEGTAFRHLLDAARAQHAIVGVLRGESPLGEIGADVGYDEQSSLCRAFRRWTAYSPLALRERLAPVAAELRPA